MKIFSLLLALLTFKVFSNPVVNVYAWGGEIPKKVIHQFEQESGIKVNFSTYDSNETMYAKLRASQKTIYDVILPSAYFVERMQKQGMLQLLDHKQLSNLHNLDEQFVKNDYDPGNRYSIPIIWGATGIFFNHNSVSNPPKNWQGLWDKKWRNQLMLLDDSREIFAIALMSLGFDPNDTNPNHIKAAYEHLLQLVPNIKLFASDSIQAIMIDEDAFIGSAWNGDAFKAYTENKAIEFIYPQDGFVIWVDCLAIPKNPPHLKEAYQFINFILKPETSAQIALKEGHAITNAAGRALLPLPIKNNPVVYPPDKILRKGYFQRDIGEETLALYNQYWEQLKLAF
ncbi:TPA: spermidine/putrescine ABC transporter substrate-binding protein [Legionella pneumophila]|uniref:Putrescine-binding periplasmic protein n=1 Tax=Legionella pneumophila subsp. pneumophila TaxID=91891 RepID=A0A3A6W637_LEGPN|nr:spermidine/putrescine ABC transporter substrate-binding protein [Legionella pneumophila]ERH42187.1 spermidine/putrescine ABC transporter substrate-binding protein [Legionella pneumophila str. Leg01/11]ERH46799.1 spermidine/putrescine ABC transporter substrate-binding protein [Legionella pneumophila str. Leg01/53]ERI48249.1 spermidine/putrescine ABC transporter substrate-binding protein [Legionella pneumophila str. Leg01/20]AGN14034.1 spermidine/putrescine transport system substrate-binding p